MLWSYPVLDPVSQAYPRVQGRSPTCYSPVRRSCTPKGLTARLACVKHAASVRPEPGSNSPLKTQDWPAEPAISHRHRVKSLTKKLKLASIKHRPPIRRQKEGKPANTHTTPRQPNPK